MFKRVTLFHFFGFDVKADASWLFLPILLAWSFSNHAFPSLYPGHEADTYQYMAIAAVAGLFISVIVHEVAHAVIAEYYDMPIDSITLFVFGGVAEMQGEPSHPKGECLMALAGPIMSGILGFFFLASAEIVRMMSGVHPLTETLQYLGQLNMLIVAFNMVPAFPLDGGRALRAILWYFRKNLVIATRQAADIGELFAFMVIAFALYKVVHDNNLVSGMWIGILGLFMTATNSVAVRQSESRALLGRETVERFMSNNIVSVSPDILISDLVENYMFAHFQRHFPVVDQGRLVGIISLSAVLQLDRAHWAWRHVGGIMEPLSDKNTISPDYNAADALDRMKKDGVESLLITDNGQFRGIVSVRDLTAYLTVTLKLDHTRPIIASR